MYRYLRDIHLVLGLCVLPFALVYAISALQMAAPMVLKAKSDTRTWEVQIPAASAARTPEAALHFLEVNAGVRGELKNSERHGDVLTLKVERPGTNYEIELRGGREAKIVEHHGNTLRVLNRLHHAVGAWTGFAASNLWGWLVIAASLALLGLGCTGILLWTQRRVERRIGLYFLCASLLYAGGLLVLIRLAA